MRLLAGVCFWMCRTAAANQTTKLGEQRWNAKSAVPRGAERFVLKMPQQRAIHVAPLHSSRPRIRQRKGMFSGAKIVGLVASRHALTLPHGGMVYGILTQSWPCGLGWVRRAGSQFISLNPCQLLANSRFPPTQAKPARELCLQGA